jgi:hypothetical protein
MIQHKQETTELRDSLNKSILLAFERTSTEPNNIENMINDVITEFPRVSKETFTLAIRDGSLGKYGKTYKLSTQDICIWIREYLKSKRPTML